MWKAEKLVEARDEYPTERVYGQQTLRATVEEPVVSIEHDEDIIRSAANVLLLFLLVCFDVGVIEP